MNRPLNSRTPKVKEFVNPPFIACPDCGNTTFGVLMVNKYQYARRCTTCWFDKAYPLPPLRKKVIYLDQFVISNMMKQLDPSTPCEQRGHHAQFFHELFEALDRACKLQLVVCPESSVHDYESVVTGPHYENLRRMFRHLSYEVRFNRPEHVFRTQIVQCFRSWLDGVPAEVPRERGMALFGDIDAWTARIRIGLNYVLPGLAQELTQLRDAKTKHLHGVCLQWQQAPDFSFKEVFQNEVAELGRSILRQYARYLAKFGKVTSGEIPVSEIAFPPQEVDLARDLLREAAKTHSDIQGRFDAVNAFFDSKDFRRLSYVKIWGLFWATLARSVRAGMKPENFPTGSIYNDLDVIAAYSPFCDAMFVDLEMENLSRQGDLGRCLASGAKIFSLRSKEAFLNYVKGLENEASREHLNLVKEVYGPSAGTPFLELLTWDKMKPTTSARAACVTQQ